VRIGALEAQIKVCMATMANGGLITVFTTPKMNSPNPSTFYGVRIARHIDNFVRGLEAYFEVTGSMVKLKR